MSVLILDNGAGNIKAGFYEDGAVQYGATARSTIPLPQVFPNVTAKVHKSMQYLISDQVNDFLNASSLNFVRPFDRGYMNNVQCEIEVWSYLFSDKFHVKPYDTTLVLSEPLLNLSSLQSDMNEIVYEYFSFHSYLRKPAACFTAHNFARTAPKLRLGLTVVDSGFSYTHIVPFINGKYQRHAVKRINVGGKLLTNYLKEMVSYRQWNMMDEFILINQVKEQLCYVSDNIINDLELARRLTRAERAQRLRKHFVLPDFQNVMKGFVKPDNELITPNEQVLVMETERMSVPELLFNPTAVGLSQAGIVEATAQSLQCLDLIEQGLAGQHIVLTGGNVNFPNLSARYARELRPFLPDCFDTSVITPERPELAAWQSMYEYVTDQMACQQFEGAAISKQQYEEWGHERVNRFFDISC